MKNVVKKISVIAMAFTLLGTSSYALKNNTNTFVATAGLGDSPLHTHNWVLESSDGCIRRYKCTNKVGSGLYKHDCAVKYTKYEHNYAVRHTSERVGNYINCYSVYTCTRCGNTYRVLDQSHHV